MPSSTAAPPAETESDPRALVLIGEPSPEMDAVASALGSLRVRLRRAADVAELSRVLSDAIGIVLLAPGTRTTVFRDLLEALREQDPTRPLFFIVSEDRSDRRVRRLYEAGAAGVFEWPRERALLARQIAEMLSLRLVRGRARKADTALARVVRTHIKMLSGLYAIPRVEVQDGAVTLTGEVPSLPLKEEVERRVEMVPGVRRLDTAGLYVLPDPVPDSRIRQGVKRLLAANPSVEERIPSLVVDAGHVTLVGTDHDRRELEHIRNLATHLPGVRAVDLRILAGKRTRREDRNMTRRLGRIVADLFSGEDLRVAFFRGVTVLQGRVGSLETKRAVERLVAEHEAVTRVVNKIDVSDPSPDPTAKGES